MILDRRDRHAYSSHVKILSAGKEMGHQSRLSSKGQTTIPAEIRDYLGLKPGDRIIYAVSDGKVELRARNLRAVDLVGVLGPPPAGPKTLREIDEGIEEAASDHAARGLT